MPVSASNLMATANSYVAAMRLLQQQIEPGEEQTSPFIMPFSLLAGFACELSLKSAVFAINEDEPELRALGHNLMACYERAVNSGYIPTDAQRAGELVDVLHEAHIGHVFRYVPDVEVIEVPDPFGAPDELSWLIADIEGQIDVWADLQA